MRRREHQRAAPGRVNAAPAERPAVPPGTAMRSARRSRAARGPAASAKHGTAWHSAGQRSQHSRLSRWRCRMEKAFVVSKSSNCSGEGQWGEALLANHSLNVQAARAGGGLSSLQPWLGGRGSLCDAALWWNLTRITRNRRCKQAGDELTCSSAWGHSALTALQNSSMTPAGSCRLGLGLEKSPTAQLRGGTCMRLGNGWMGGAGHGPPSLVRAPTPCVAGTPP